MVVLITYEDETITSPDERVIHFGYTEDVRLYGTDFIQRVRNAGFDVQVHVAFGKRGSMLRTYYGREDFQLSENVLCGRRSLTTRSECCRTPS